MSLFSGVNLLSSTSSSAGGDKCIY